MPRGVSPLPRGGPASVGPNAVIQTAEALHHHGGAALADRVFTAAGLDALLTCPPTTMVTEVDAARLHRSLGACLGAAEARAVAADAGARTADYLLAHRIPPRAQRLLRALPARLAARLLLGAITRNAWTFAGSGHVRAQPGRPAVALIMANPLAIPGCPWHGAVIGGLFRQLVHPGATVTETGCTARGASGCRFRIDY